MRSSEKVMRDSPIESRDGRSILRYVTGRIVKDQKKNWRALVAGEELRKGPALVVGFPGPGLVGSISASYVIEKMNLRQIAFIDSDFVVPTVIFTGGRLRHPFRIYSNDSGSLFVVVCEAPVLQEGINSIMDLVATWAKRNNIWEVIVLDGAPVRGFPSKDRKAEVLRSYNVHNSDPAQSARSTKNASVKPNPELIVKNAVITGLSAGVLEACLSFNIPCTGILIPTTSGVPDPEGAAILLETVSAMPHVPIEIDVDPLRKQGDEIKKQLAAFIEELHSQQLERRPQRQGSHPHLGQSTIYG
jgi:uncharacterized protein